MARYAGLVIARVAERSGARRFGGLREWMDESGRVQPAF
jgi:hypothetical protein